MASTPDRWIRLSDGRRLAFVEYGDSAGEPTFYFHGSPGNRLNPVLDVWGRDSGIRFIAFDRPGYGGSSPRPGRRLVDLGDDLAELADHLHLARFSLAGVSGGGPAVLACALRLADRVRTSAVVSGTAPPEAPLDGMGAARRRAMETTGSSPDRYARQLALGFWLSSHLPSALLARMLSKVPADTPEADRQLLARDDVRAVLLDAARSLRWRDGTATAGELRLYRQPWGFDLADIRTHVELWHGRADPTVPVAAARHVAARLPDAHLTEVPDGGHLLMFQRWRDILSRLVAAARSRP